MTPRSLAQYFRSFLVKLSMIHLTLPDGTNMPYYINRADKKWKQQFRDSSLLHRGWALQERLLSIRTIRFDKLQIYGKFGFFPLE